MGGCGDMLYNANLFQYILNLGVKIDRMYVKVSTATYSLPRKVAYVSQENFQLSKAHIDVGKWWSVD